MIRRMYWVFLVGLLCFMKGLVVDAAELDAKRATEFLETALESVKSFDIRTEVTQRSYLTTELSGTKDDIIAGTIKEITVVKRSKRDKPIVQQHSFRQVFQRGKERIELLSGPSGNFPRYIVFDGALEKNWDPKTGWALIREPERFVVGEGYDYLDCYRNLYRPISLVKPLKDRQNAVLKVMGAPEKFVFLETAPVPSKRQLDLADWGYRIGLDPRHGFMPAVIERFIHLDGQPFVERRTTVTAWKDLLDGVRVPIRVTTQVFDKHPGKGAFGELDSEVELTVNVAKSSWNQEIADETFHLPLPAGTRVTDLDREVKYVTGQADPGRNLQDLAANARDLIPIQTGKSRPQESSWLWWLGGGATIFVATVIGVWYLRKRRRERHT